MTGKTIEFRPRPPINASPIFHVGFEMEVSEQTSARKIHAHADELAALGAAVDEREGFTDKNGQYVPTSAFIGFNLARKVPLDREKFEAFLSRLFEIIPADHVREANFQFCGNVDKQTADKINGSIIDELDKGRKVKFDALGPFINPKLTNGIRTELSAAEIEYIPSVHDDLNPQDMGYVAGPGHYEMVGTCFAVEKSGFGLTPTAETMTAKIMDGLAAINELHRTAVMDIMRTGRRTEAMR